MSKLVFINFNLLSHSMKILHIEDVPEISQIFADILSTKNYDFDSVSDGKSWIGIGSLQGL